MSGWRRIGNINGGTLPKKMDASINDFKLTEHAIRVISNYPMPKSSYSFFREAGYISFESQIAVKAIAVRFVEGKLGWYFYGSSLYDKELKLIAARFGFKIDGKTFFRDDLTNLHFNFLDQLLNFMHAVNRAKYTFTPKMIHEAELLHLYITTHFFGDNNDVIEPFLGPLFDHTILEIPDKINIERVGPAPLVKLLAKDKNLDNEVVKAIKGRLVTGIDVDQCDHEGTSGLKKAVIVGSSFPLIKLLQLIKLFLQYGADPFAEFTDDECLYVQLQNRSNFCVIRHRAYRIRYAGEIFQCFQNWISRVRREPSLQIESSRQEPSVKIERVELLSKDGQIVTKFYFNNNEEIETCFKRNTELTEDERETIAELIIKKHTRKDDKDGARIAADAMSEMNVENGCVEILRYKGKIIGFVFTQLRIFEDKQQCQLYCSLAYLEPAFRKRRLANLLLLRSAYGLQLMRPNFNFLGFMICVTQNSYRLLDDYVFFPKYQPGWLTVDIIKKMFESYFPGDSYTLVRKTDNPLTCYFKDQMIVPDVCVNPEAHYYAEVIDCATLPAEQDTDGRGPPACFVTSPGTFNLLGNCFLTIEIFYQYITQITQMLAHNIFNENISPDIRTIRSHIDFFWDGPAKQAVTTQSSFKARL